MECTGADRARARAAIQDAEGSVKLAIVMVRLGVKRDAAVRALESAGGVLRRAIGDPPPVAG
jgi:N-acetylmuramic acid 6-phosphate etherase